MQTTNLVMVVTISGVQCGVTIVQMIAPSSRNVAALQRQTAPAPHIVNNQCLQPIISVATEQTGNGFIVHQY